LQWTGSVRNGLLPLAVRVETLLITSSGEITRPPRRIAFALAVYLRSLAKTSTAPRPPAWTPGSNLFSRHCAGCHRADGTTGEAVALERIGTDAAVGLSDRWTGSYRVPSLWGVAGRPLLLHDASVGSVEELLTAERLGTNPGHEPGTTLSSAERESLVDFVLQIGASEASPDN
jgi:hypothetical protein